ncbi:ribosomal protein S18-alanine N-acetyltransferase [Vagococcus salmoninarum]|uniref:[Ribosomal protein bS18]-alanine N-acetyltransferase n=1 Tax=Vagococcus salmoninarum TaxID=2739 RepID=A0A429ZES0_9ENTE|nr:ribosomal protein S18-alanine N-acetyltransferase [Vagococcus salmoninarum]RST92179.1 ribosomal-protein-alanine N-acetyltransferase [Vagococcus salmoninarum]
MNQDFETPQTDLAQKFWDISELAYDYGSPWTKAQFLADLQNERSFYFLTETPKGLLGYVIFHQVLDEAEIINIAVDPSVKGQKVAMELFEKALATMASQGVKSFFLEVRRTNQAAIGLYRKAGFQEIGIRKNYYHNPREDGIMMQKIVNEVD